MEQDVTDILEEKGATEGSIDVEDTAWVDVPQGLETPAIKVGIEKELNLADEWAIYDVTSREEAYGHSLEDTRWVIRFDAEDGSSVIVQPNDLERHEHKRGTEHQESAGTLKNRSRTSTVVPLR